MTELKISSLVNSGQEIVSDYVVPNGQKARIVFYISQPPDSPLAVIKIIWDKGGASEEIMWSSQRGEKLRAKDLILEKDGDGSKKISLVAKNDCTDNYYFSAYLKIETI